MVCEMKISGKSSGLIMNIVIRANANVHSPVVVAVRLNAVFKVGSP